MNGGAIGDESRLLPLEQVVLRPRVRIVGLRSRVMGLIRGVMRRSSTLIRLITEVMGLINRVMGLISGVMGLLNGVLRDESDSIVLKSDLLLHEGGDRRHESGSMGDEAGLMTRDRGVEAEVPTFMPDGRGFMDDELVSPPMIHRSMGHEVAFMGDDRALMRDESRSTARTLVSSPDERRLQARAPASQAHDPGRPAADHGFHRG